MAFGILANSGASGGSGVMSNSSCNGTMYSKFFPPPEALLITDPVYPSASKGITDIILLQFPPILASNTTKLK